MIPSFKQLEKILLQEQKLGYQNKAVIGGLERFANNWFPQALKETTTKEERLIIEKLAAELKNYAQCNTLAEQEQAIDQMLGILRGDIDVASGRPETGPSSQTASESEVSEERPSGKAQASPPPERSGKPEPALANVKPSPGERSPKNAILALEGLDAPVTRLPGIKKGYADKLARLGVTTIGDLLTLYPHRYDDYRSLKTINQLTYGEDVTIIVQVWQTRKRQSRTKKPIITTTLSDGTGTIEATWFNQPWLENKLTTGRQIVLSGRVSQYLGRLTFQSPDWEPLDKTQIHTGRLVPVYPLTSGITAKWLRRLQKRTVDYWAQRLPDHLPDEVRERQNLMPLHKATSQVHFPESWESLEAARRRLAFDELLLIQLGVLKQKQLWKSQTCPPLNINRDVVDNFVRALPFALTNAQTKALNELLDDLAKPVPMSRLLQGDVGSGKTVVALAVMLATIADGGQATILAPTEILAEQHYTSMRNLLETAGQADQVNLRLLTGSTKASERETILASLTDGTVQLLVGTHAIIQEGVSFKNLRLAVVDEQHRFGVEQRGLLRQKGLNPHMLVMSATPIPRSLALTLYGDLDLSIIDEMPPGRQPVVTRWLKPTERERAYAFLRSQIEKGLQAFIICPLVEESDKIEARSAIKEHQRLQEEIFPDLKLDLLHGRMSGQEKDTIMADFRDKKTHILVSTSVVEVGIDIPNASAILIEGANHFGLAQLHQFRGRVGRGQHKSYCLLLADNAGTEAQTRLEVMEKTNDGFKLAEEDLKLRGPGEFFGTKQSGLPNLKLVKLSDTKLLDLARTEAMTIFEQDPNLDESKHQLLAKRVQTFWAKVSDPS
jgi:ATP-dependent DNA helicase RecG